MEPNNHIQVEGAGSIPLGDELLDVNLLDLVNVEHVFKGLRLHLPNKDPTFSTSLLLLIPGLERLIFVIQTLGENLVVLHL